MAYTQADIDALRRKIATGEKSLTHGDTTRVKFDIDQLHKTLKIMEAEVNGRGNRRTLATFRSGA